MAVKSIWRTLGLVFMAFFVLLPPAKAQEVVFPLACNAGVNCFIISYPDLDKTEGVARDYTCGPSAKDGDGMLRIALSSIQDLRQGFSVMAIRDGKVIDAQDGNRDLFVSSKQQLKRGTSMCGNGVVIDHGAGVQSAYCHLRQGSIRVETGQSVKAGDVIAEVGQSGVAFWPQLGFSMQSSGLFVDPISSMTEIEGCGWRQRPMIPLPPAFTHYQPAAIVGMGFSLNPIADKTLSLGRVPRVLQMDRMAQQMNLWAMVLGVHKGDKIEVRLRDPRGRTFEYREIIADNDHDHMPVNVTRARGYSGWRQGAYTGEITVTREVEYRPVSVSQSTQMTVR